MAYRARAFSRGPGGSARSHEGPSGLSTAAARLRAAYPDVRFVCLGEGPIRYRQALEELATSAGLDGTLIWAGNRTDMPSVYNALDLAVSASIYGEGVSNMLGEAMASGVPCVTTAVGDSAWVVGETGVVVPPGRPAALAEGIAAQWVRYCPRRRSAEAVSPSAYSGTPERASADRQYPRGFREHSHSMIRICHIITGLPAHGAERMLHKLLSGMDRERFQPTVISLMDKGTVGPAIGRWASPCSRWTCPEEARTRRGCYGSSVTCAPRSRISSRAGCTTAIWPPPWLPILRLATHPLYGISVKASTISAMKSA